MPKRLAVVGLGGWASSMHLPVCRRLQEEGRARYCGLCDRDASKAERAASDLGGKPYTDVDEMLKAEKPDGLIILVKPDATPGLIQKAIEFRLPFLTEKPPTPSVAVHRKLMEAAEGLPHVIGYNRRFTPYASAAREWLKGHSLRSVEASLFRFRRLEADFTGTAIHALDAALFLAGGRIAEVRIETVRKDSVRDLFLTAWTEEHCRIAVSIAPHAAFTEENYAAYAASRGAKIEHPQQDTNAGRARLFEDNALRKELAPRDFGMAENDWPALSGILDEHLHFSAVLDGNQTSMATLKDTLNTQILREAFADLAPEKSRCVREFSMTCAE